MGKVAKQFCHKGHDTLVNGKYESGSCKLCVKFRAQSRNWKVQGILNPDGTQFRTIDFDRLYQIQQGKCAIVTCGKHQSNLYRALDVDHDHKTGIVRGLLCDSCNKKLGVLEDETFSFHAHNYLKREVK